MLCSSERDIGLPFFRQVFRAYSAVAGVLFSVHRLTLRLVHDNSWRE